MLVQTCPVRALVLDRVDSFNDAGMEALSSAQYLESLEFVRCQEITDEGVRLNALRLVKCLGVSDDRMKPLVGFCKLEHSWWRIFLRFPRGASKGQRNRSLIGRTCHGCTKILHA
ncbi:hypothetical protein MLD38_021396 [Melastoma candidum]|uniref:Uncharacterized protein n=1 Tax=Melastoma candidum TaxID=119954 RepID=A0ACB9QFZ1_9MYRT|nr:hypothetical protein MLD38_021396 [Melastoma candidum]